MKKINSIRINILIIFFILFIAVIFYNKYNLNTKIKHELEASIEEVKISVDTTLHYFKKATQNINHFISTNEKILKIIKEAKDTKDDTRKKELRLELQNILTPPYERIKNVGAFQFHFVLPNNESFLRMHYPEKYGDILTEIRETYNYVHKHKKAVYGFENGKVLHSFRYVYPLFDEEKNYIGAYEISSPSENIQENLTNLNKLHNHFIIKKRVDV